MSCLLLENSYAKKFIRTHIWCQIVWLSICMTRIKTITHRDWFKVDLYEDRIDIKMDTYAAEKMTFNEAADYTARLIADRYPKIYVKYSGGYDSEFVCKVLLRNRIAFTPVIFKNPFVLDEYDFAEFFCNENNLDPILITDSIESIVRLCRLIFNKKGIDLFPLGFANLYAEKAVNDGGILLGGDCHPFNDQEMMPGQHGLQDFYINILASKEHIHFYNYTPEIYISMVNEMINSKGQPTQRLKSKLYDLPFRSKMGYNQFMYDRKSWLRVRPLIEQIMEFKKNVKKQEDFVLSDEFIEEIMNHDT
jgi:hypothetical protein